METSQVKILTEEQRERAVQVLREYLAAPADADGLTPEQAGKILDENRLAEIANRLNPLLQGYLRGQMALSEFKTTIDSVNKRNEYWGFKGIKGQMFFNMLVNASSDQLLECDAELKSVLWEPTSEDICKSRLRTFISYVQRLGQEIVESGGSKHSRPQASSIPFFVSYFWQIQHHEVWPVQYTNSINTISDLDLWRPSGDLAEDYIAFKHVYEELRRIYADELDVDYSLYDVEHVMWFKGNQGRVVSSKASEPVPSKQTEETPPSMISLISDSYVPPVVALLPVLARNDEQVSVAAEAAKSSIVRMFERNINAAFTILGFDTHLMGQGSGRNPDGRAVSADDSYAIIWDAKVRAEMYRMGTDDRAIREYLSKQSRELKRRLRNIYYCIISSTFASDFDETIRALKMETDVNEVVLMEADALVEMVDAKLRSPNEISLGSDGIQRLFCQSGILTGEMARDMLS